MMYLSSYPMRKTRGATPSPKSRKLDILIGYCEIIPQHESVGGFSFVQAQVESSVG